MSSSSFPPPPPPPDPGLRHPDPDRPDGRRWGWKVTAAAATAGVVLGFGGVVVASSVWSAASDDDPPAVVEASAVEPDGPAGDDAGEVELPPELGELVDGVEVFAACVEDRLGATHGDGTGLPPIVEGPGTVVVIGPDGEPTIVDLGAGDGRVVVDKSGDEVSVDVSGDATALDGAELRDLVAGGVADLADALDACREELPPLPSLDDVLEGLDPGRLPGLEDLPLDELPGLDELPPLDELPGLDGELGDVPLDELLDDLLEQLPPELRQAFED